MPAVNDILKKVTNAVTLNYGKKDAVLIDIFLTIDQAKGLTDSIAGTGKTLKYIYITHTHSAHFYGLQIILDRFAGAKANSTKAISDNCYGQVAPEVIRNFWEPRFPGQIPTKLAAGYWNRRLN